MHVPRFRRAAMCGLLAGFAAAPLAACVTRTPAADTVADVALRVDTRTAGGALDFAQAWRLARARNPEIRRLEAEARAARLDVPGLDLGGEVERGVEGDVMAMATLDPFAWLSLGPRGAEIDLALRRHAAALARLRAAEQGLAADLARIFRSEAVLAEVLVPRLDDVDAVAFAAAGLASPVARAMLDAALMAADAEGRAIAAERRANLARLRSAIGAGPAAPLAIVRDGSGPSLPTPSPASPAAAVRARLLRHPDIDVALADLFVADAEFAVAVNAQYPVLRLGPRLVVDPDGAIEGLGEMLEFRVPLFQGKAARAAEQRLEAARVALEQAWLEALQRADEREARLAAAVAGERSMAAEAQAAALAVRSGRARLEVDSEMFDAFAEAAGRAIRDSRAARIAALERVDAEIALAAALGWPLPGELAEVSP